MSVYVLLFIYADIILCQWQFHLKGIDSVTGFGPYTSFMFLHYILCYGEPQSVGMVHGPSLIYTIETFEYVLQILI